MVDWVFFAEFGFMDVGLIKNSRYEEREIEERENRERKKKLTSMALAKVSSRKSSPVKLLQDNTLLSALISQNGERT